MASNLDRSLDEILATRRRAITHRGANKTAVAGGIRKRPQRATAQKAIASRPSGKVFAPKIIVSNLVCHTPRRYLFIFLTYTSHMT